MRSLALIGVLGLLGMFSSPAWAQKAEVARYQRAAVRGLARLDDSAVLEKAVKGKGADEARASGAQLAARGVARLSAEDLKRRAELLLEFTGRSKSKACAKWALGTASGEEVIKMVAKLDSVELDAWVDLSLRAAVAEARRKPRAFAGTDADVGKLFERLPTTMTEAEAKRFHEVMAKIDRAKDKDACWFGRQLYISALALEPKQRDHALRTLAWIELQPG